MEGPSFRRARRLAGRLGEQRGPRTRGANRLRVPRETLWRKSSWRLSRPANRPRRLRCNSDEIAVSRETPFLKVRGACYGQSCRFLSARAAQYAKCAFVGCSARMFHVKHRYRREGHKRVAALAATGFWPASTCDMATGLAPEPPRCTAAPDRWPPVASMRFDVMGAVDPKSRPTGQTGGITLFHVKHVIDRQQTRRLKPTISGEKNDHFTRKNRDRSP